MHSNIFECYVVKSTTNPEMGYSQVFLKHNISSSNHFIIIFFKTTYQINRQTTTKTIILKDFTVHVKS